MKDKVTAVDVEPLSLSKRGFIVDFYFWNLVGDSPPSKFDEMWDFIEVLYENADDFVKEHVSRII